jgi:hypothetical protein
LFVGPPAQNSKSALRLAMRIRIGKWSYKHSTI